MEREQSEGEPDAQPVTEATLAPEGRRVDVAGSLTSWVEVEGFDQLELIGRGGYATVWRARQISIDRTVALKVLDLPIDDDATRERLRFESSSLAELSWNPNVVHIYDSGTTADGRPYLVMEHVSGGTLATLVRTRGRLEPADVVRIGVSLTDAVGAAHELGVLHRDVKPDNVLLDRRGDAKLTDFGIARLAGATATDGTPFVGTIRHAAPEVLDGSAPTPAGDVWGIGSTLYTLLSGHPPFAPSDGGDDSITAVIKRVLLEDPTPLPEDVPPGVTRVILDCLGKEPEDRPTPEDLLTRLTMLRDQLPAARSTPLATALPSSVADAAAAGSAAAGATAITSAPAGGGTVDRTGAVDDPGAGDGAGDGPVAGAVGGDRSGRRRAGTLAMAVLLAVVVSVGVGWTLTRSDEPEAAPTEPGESAEDAGDGGPSTTGAPGGDDEPEGDEGSPRRASGVNERRPGPEGMVDTSQELRNRLTTFAASALPPVLGASPSATEFGGEQLRFGELPAQIDYGATNVINTRACHKVFLDELDIVGAAGAVWWSPGDAVLVTAVQLADELAARRYYWATAMHLGLSETQCSGWPNSGIVVDPDELRVERQDFEIPDPPDEHVTALDDRVSIEVIPVAEARNALALVGDTVVVVNTGSSSTQDAAAAATVVSQAIAAFRSS